MQRRNVAIGERFADEFELEKIIHLPKSEPGNKRFADRNRLIIRDSEEIVAFWDGKSPGKQRLAAAPHNFTNVSFIYCDATA